MTDEEIDELISKETGRYPKEDMMMIPKNKFNIGDNVVLNFDTEKESVSVIYDIYWCSRTKSWEYSVVTHGFISAHNLDENIIKLI